MLMAFNPRKRIEELVRDANKLCKAREAIESRLANVFLAVTSLAREIEDEDERNEIMQKITSARRPPGLTEAIARSLRDKPYTDFSASEVRNWLEREGVDLSQYSQPLATISVTLARMAKRGRVKVFRKGRSVSYQWKGDGKP